MSSVCYLDDATDARAPEEKWVFVSGRRSTGPALAVRGLRTRVRSSRPVLHLAEVPEYGSGDAELAAELDSVADARWE